VGGIEGLRSITRGECKKGRKKKKKNWDSYFFSAKLSFTVHEYAKIFF
jgi:hypothetical protein